MTTRKTLTAVSLTITGFAALGLLITVILSLTMPADWPQRSESEFVRKLCFVVLMVGGAINAVIQMRAKKQAEREAAEATTARSFHPARRTG